MHVLITGVAGFIGFHVAKALLARGEKVVGIDNLNPYYDVALKEARLAELEKAEWFDFHKGDVADRELFVALKTRYPDIREVVHLAAQAGVRHSLEAPADYVHSNLVGQLQVLEYCRSISGLEHLVYASSSSVYGGNSKTPFAESDPVNEPLSLYGATKRADELMVQSYSHLYRIPATGLRFFTVYGPYGRPDMAYYRFAEAMDRDEPITLYNNGDMARDFTYIDDIVSGVITALDRPPEPQEGDDGKTPHRVFNLGNNRPETLQDFVAALEQAMSKKAMVEHGPLQPGDALRTCADISKAAEALGYHPQTRLAEGMAAFATWFREYEHGE